MRGIPAEDRDIPSLMSFIYQSSQCQWPYFIIIMTRSSSIITMTTIAKYRMQALTPSQSTELQDVGGYVDIEDFHQGEVHVYCLQAHPRKGGQEEVVHGDRHGPAEDRATERWQPGVEQKYKVKSFQSQCQVQQDLRRVVSAELPVRIQT